MTDREREVFAAMVLIAPVAGTIISMILVELSDRLHAKRVKDCTILFIIMGGNNK